MDIVNIISEYSLVVRCLPSEVVSYRTYTEGDENKTYVNSKGEVIEAKREVVIQDYDLDYFRNTKPSNYNTATPE